MFENFPYTDMHQLNLDWIVKIAKDFLDQYTTIQETISTGMDDLTNKATELENLLQEWYDTHSEDIGTQLAQALNDINAALETALVSFSNRADAKAAETIESIPDDYTELANKVSSMFTGLNYDLNNLLVPARLTDGIYIDNHDGTEVTYEGWSATDYIPFMPRQRMWAYFPQGTGYCALYDENHDFIAGTSFTTGVNDWVLYDVNEYVNVRYIRISNGTTHMKNTKIIMFPVADNTLTKRGYYADAKITGDKIDEIKTRLDNSIPGMKLSAIFKNDIVFEAEQATTTVPASVNYREQKLQDVSLLPNTDYYIYCGRIISPMDSSQVRLYVKYVNDSTWHNCQATKQNGGFAHIKTTDQTIEESAVYLIGTSGETTPEAITAIFSDIAVFKGVNLELRKPFTDYQMTIPDYFKTQLDSKKYNIVANSQNSSMTGDSFIFITDTHFTVNNILNHDIYDLTYNSCHAHQLIDYIMENTPVRQIIFGGDLCNVAPNVGQMLLSMNTWEGSYKDLKSRLRYCVGNHEYYTDIGSDVPDRPTPQSLYGSSAKYNETTIGGKQSNCTYYYDNPVQKIRYFVISCGRDTELSIAQTEWILSEFANVPDDYTIVCIGHAFLLDDVSDFRGYYKIIVQGLDALKTRTTYAFNGNTYNYANSNAIAGFIMTGHTHMDYVKRSTGNIPCIATACDSWYLNYELVNGSPVQTPRQLNTIEEQCFDVVQFDTYSKVVKLTRIGYGSDRTIQY